MFNVTDDVEVIGRPDFIGDATAQQRNKEFTHYRDRLYELLNEGVRRGLIPAETRHNILKSL